MNNAWLGIDPGLTGALAIISSDGNIDLLPMPLAGKELNIGSIVIWIRQHPSNMITYIEDVHSMPKQGVSSVFKFGFVTGMLHGIIRCLGIPLYKVTPQAWKKEILAGTDKSKQAAIDYCLRAYPNVKLFRTEKSRTYDDGMADALLIAEYAKRKHQ